MTRPSELTRLIRTVSMAQEVLEPEALKAVCDFVRSKQTTAGTFVNRNSKPDWYYSFFGYILAKALGLTPELNKLQHVVLSGHRPEINQPVDQAALIILHHAFKPRLVYKIITSIKLIGMVFSRKHNTGKIYQTFIYLLAINHLWGWNRCIYQLMGHLTRTYRLDENTPTPQLAAALMIKQQAGFPTSELCRLLLKNQHPEGGFVMFQSHRTADMLSTAVATYALNQARSDNTTYAAGCFDFISSRFDRGAFLSGDGDPTRDLEYTFYGLLALGVLVQPLYSPDKSTVR